MSGDERGKLLAKQVERQVKFSVKAEWYDPHGAYSFIEEQMVDLD